LGNQRQQSNVSKLINAEPTGDKLTKALNEFAEGVVWSRWDFWDKLTDHVAVDKRDMIVGIGAPSRGTILINYLGLNHNDLSFVAEREGSLKIGRYIPGTLVPVVAEDWVLEQNPDYALILSWHIADAIMQNWRAQGYKGKFIVPLPEPRIVD
jgi:hypothetical protein